MLELFDQSFKLPCIQQPWLGYYGFLVQCDFSWSAKSKLFLVFIGHIYKEAISPHLQHYSTTTKKNHKCTPTQYTQKQTKPVNI